MTSLTAPGRDFGGGCKELEQPVLVVANHGQCPASDGVRPCWGALLWAPMGHLPAAPKTLQAQGVRPQHCHKSPGNPCSSGVLKLPVKIRKAGLSMLDFYPG